MMLLVHSAHTLSLTVALLAFALECAESTADERKDKENAHRKKKKNKKEESYLYEKIRLPLFSIFGR